jgi:hypothetical protein
MAFATDASLASESTLNADADGNASDLERMSFVDHFSLKSSSSTVKFRSGNIHIHHQSGSQFMLEEYNVVETESDGRNSQLRIVVKRSDSSSHGEAAVRALYSAIAVFMGACIFIFSIGLLLFLFADLATQLAAWDSSKIFVFFGTLLAVPILVDGLTYLLVLTTGFVVDVFNGHPLLQSFGWGSVTTSWISFLAFGAVPLFAFIGSLMIRRERILDVTLISSFVSVGLFFLFFIEKSCRLLVGSSLDLVEEFGGHKMSLFQKIKMTVWICARSKLSGKQQDLHVYESSTFDLKDTSSSKTSHIYASRGKLWLRMTQMMGCLVQTLDVPQRRWTQSEVSGALPFLTKYSWNLEHVFCRSRMQDSIVVTGGRSALTNKQALSSSVCYFLGILIYILMVCGVLVWLQLPTVLTVVITALCFVYLLSKTIRAAKLAKKVNEQINSQMDTTIDGEGAGLVQKWECFTITRPTDATVATFLLFHVLFCFVYPFSYLCWSGNIPGAITFIFMAAAHFQQTSLDSIEVVEELGSDMFGMKNESSGSERSEWKYKSRVFHLLRLNTYRGFWSRAIGAFVWLFVVVAVAAVFSNGDDAESAATSSDNLSPRINFPNSTFNYQDNRMQARCKFDAESSSTIQYLADYAFLGACKLLNYVMYFIVHFSQWLCSLPANLPYFEPQFIQSSLDIWFGSDNAVFHQGAQQEFRQIHSEFDSPVRYELVSFPVDSTAAVLVRGTTTFFDYFADAKLWYSTALFQVFRETIPFGDFFTPLIRFNIGALALLETSSIKKSAYYIETTEFIEYVKGSGEYSDVLITGMYVQDDAHPPPCF